MKFIRANRLIVLGFALVVAVLVVNGVASYWNTTVAIENEQEVSHSHELMGAIDKVLLAAVDAETGQRGYLLTGREEFLKPYQDATERVARGLREADTLAADNLAQQARLQKMREAVLARMDHLGKTIEVRRTGATVPLATLSQGKQSMDVIRALAKDTVGVEAELLNARERTAESSRRRTFWSFAVATALGLGTVGAAYILLQRDANARRKHAAALAELAADNRRILQSTGDGIYGIDTAGHCTFLNRAGGQLLGYEPEAVLGKDMHTLTHHTRADGTAYPVEDCPIYKVLRTGQGGRVDGEYFYRSDGSRFPAEYTSHPIIKDGVLSGAVVTFTDVTARWEAEALMREERERLQAMADAMPQIVWVTRPDGHHEYYNRRWYEFTGTKPGATDGEGWSNLFHPEDQPVAWAKWQHSLATGDPYEVEYRLRRYDGQYRWQLGRALPGRNRTGRIERWYGTCTDIHDAKMAEQELADAKRAAEDANQAKSAFLANMSHELRTPLNAVIMYSELLQEEAQDIGRGEQFGPDLDRIRGAGKHLLALVNGVLDLSKIEAGKMELELETFDLPAAVAEVVGTIQPLMDKKGNTLTVDCPADVGVVYADTTKLRQVLFNLLSNANKFTERGRITLTARRDRDPAGDKVLLTVTDTGIGMTEEQIGKLFQPFTQADASTTRRFGGTGLGLTISKRFAEMMGGTVTVSSVPDQGTTFTFELPARVAAVEAIARTSAPPLPADAPAMLVIDDDAGVRELMTRALSAQGVRPLLAADGVEGLRLAREHKPAAVFLDVIMPRLDGWSVLAALKGDPAFKDTPIVMLTVIGDQDMGYMLGAADYLQKPIEREQLTSVLARYKPAPGGRVLVVDDDPGTREVLRRALVKDGWEVDEAENGRLALDRVRAGTPALVLLDLLMPEMSGFEFVRELRKTPAWAGIPVVVLTSKDLTPEERQMLAGNVERVMQKGAYSRDALLAEVNKVVTAFGGRTKSNQEG